MTLKFERISTPITGMQAWAATDASASYIVTFDARYPQFGFSASFRLNLAPATEYLETEFRTMRAARVALQSVSNKMRQ